jgi:hypothetical protein
MTKVDWGQIWLGSDFKQMGVGATNNDVSQMQAHLLLGLVYIVVVPVKMLTAKKSYCQHTEFKPH